MPSKEIQVKGKPCPGCKTQKEFTVFEDDYKSWKSGTLIQRAMPYLSNSEREAFITGYCDPCWEKLFPKEHVGEEI